MLRDDHIEGAAPDCADGSSDGFVRRSRKRLPRIVSLFCGAGGLDLGFKQAGFNIDVAVDSEPAAIRTHQRNFPRTAASVADLQQIGPTGVLALTLDKIPEGARLGVIGGPPCQGFSRANNASESSDPRNRLPQLYISAVKLLQQHYDVEFVVFENVLGIRDRKHAATYCGLTTALRARGFSLSEAELCALDFGVPQLRRRIILTGMAPRFALSTIRFRKRQGPATVREALEGLPEPTFFTRGLRSADEHLHPNHWTMMPKSRRFTEPGSTIPGGRSFKRLVWDEPSPTVAYGNREIHVHPEGRRRVSVFEAMLLQGFPADFVLEGNLSEQVTQISNAVPPPMGRSIAQAIRRILEGS